MRFSRFINLGIMISLLGISIACSNTGDGTGQPIGEETESDELLPTQASIQRNFISTNCLSCHRSATPKNKWVDLNDLSNVIEGNGGRRDLIKPGCPKESLLVTIMTEGKMPPPPLYAVPKDTIETIEKWVISLNPQANCREL